VRCAETARRRSARRGGRASELLDGADETNAALLHEVFEGQAVPQVAPGLSDHEPQVRLDQARLGLGIAALDAARERDLLGCAEQRHPSHGVEVGRQRPVGELLTTNKRREYRLDLKSRVLVL
jgi:hypothetical protein